jgi:exopolyphosphatase/pppGpp-phosphohydrolase
MSIDSLSTLLREAQHEVHRHQYTHALKIIRDAKIFDLHNLYLLALEHFVAKLPYPSSPDFTNERSMENEHILSLLIDRAVSDRMRRDTKRSEGLAVPDERTLLLEKIKNQYFQRTDQFIEAKEFGRALEEIERIYFFDPNNIVAKEYQLKIGQLAELNKK